MRACLSRVVLWAFPELRTDALREKLAVLETREANCKCEITVLLAKHVEMKQRLADARSQCEERGAEVQRLHAKQRDMKRKLAQARTACHAHERNERALQKRELTYVLEDVLCAMIASTFSTSISSFVNTRDLCKRSRPIVNDLGKLIKCFREEGNMVAHERCVLDDASCMRATNAVLDHMMRSSNADTREFLKMARGDPDFWAHVARRIAQRRAKLARRALAEPLLPERFWEPAPQQTTKKNPLEKDPKKK